VIPRHAASRVGTIGRSGLEGGDGLITIALGIVIALLGIAILIRRGSGWTARIGAIVCAVALRAVALAGTRVCTCPIRSIVSELPPI